VEAEAEALAETDALALADALGLELGRIVVPPLSCSTPIFTVMSSAATGVRATALVTSCPYIVVPSRSNLRAASIDMVL